MLSGKCFKHHLNGKIIKQNELWTSVMSYTFTIHKIVCVLCVLDYLSAEFLTVNTGLGRSMFWKAPDMNH